MQVLVVTKKSAYQLYVKERDDPAYKRAIVRDEATAERLRTGHQRQEQAIERVEATLEKRGVRFKSRWRGRIRSSAGFSLVIAVGGDGTLLDTSQWLRDDTPLLGVNSDPSTSVGMLCACTADGLGAQLDAIDAGLLKPTAHTRLRVRVDGIEVLGPCLNDLLFAHRSPADMSRFDLAVKSTASIHSGLADEIEHAEFIRGSGIWISTATGSTAAIRSAGGKVMPQRSRRVQYLVREPYSAPQEPRAAHRHGFLRPDESLAMVSRIHAAAAWADGPHRRAPVRYGQTVIVDAHPQPLLLYRRSYR